LWIARTPASADVRAIHKCWALELPQARFQEIMVTYPQVLAYVSELGDARRTQNQVRDGRVELA
jgi:CRP-like cAMP-binding protein